MKAAGPKGFVKSDIGPRGGRTIAPITPKLIRRNGAAAYRFLLHCNHLWLMQLEVGV